METFHSLQHPAPNMVPGMRVTTHHFDQIFAWISALSADGLSIFMGGKAFGLIGTNPQAQKTNFDLQIEDDVLVLKKFAVMFPDGRLAAGSEGLTAEIQYSLTSLVGGTYDILLICDPQQHQAFGTPDPAETPYRHPYRNPACRLDVVPSGSLALDTSPEAIKIAELSFEQDCFRFSESYIPPCVHLRGYQTLWQKYLDYRRNWRQFYTYSVDILQKTSPSDPSPVIQSLRKMAEEIGQYTAQNSVRVQGLGRTAAPLELIQLCTSLAAMFHFYLETLPNEAELIELFKRHVKSLPGYDDFQRQGFRDAVRTAANLVHDPLDMAHSLQVLDVFFDEALTTWHRLSEASQLLYVPAETSKMFIR
ncbi:MAG: hypothetical protein AAF206_13995 [Bacteroidota bacterium]